MFKNSHVGRPTNKEIRSRKTRKILLIMIPIVAIVAIVGVVTNKNLFGLSGNSVTDYSCPSSDYKLEGNNCVIDLSEKSVLFGDINSDETIDISDLELLKKYVANDKEVTFTKLQIKVADINLDGKVTELDAKMLENYFNNSTAISTSSSEKIGVERICPDGYKLNGTTCNYKRVILAKNKLDAPQPKGTTFRIKFTGGDATSGSMSDQVITYGTATKIKANAFKKTGYIFDGWRVLNQSRGGNYWACKYYSNGKLVQGYAPASDCVNYIVYKDMQTIARTADPGETIIMYAQWKKQVCSTSYKCNKGVKAGDGPSASCLIDLGAAKATTVYKCPKSYMKKESSSKCSYNAHYVTSSYYTCPDGGKLLGKKCYISTIKKIEYSCSSGSKNGKRCYKSEPVKAVKVCG